MVWCVKFKLEGLVLEDVELNEKQYLLQHTTAYTHNTDTATTITTAATTATIKDKAAATTTSATSITTGTKAKSTEAKNLRNFETVLN